jgi:RNA polymerase sigma-70 factor (ECF subfamily)
MEVGVPQTVSSEVTGSNAGPTDEVLLEAARGGDRDAFDSLVHRYEKELYGYLRRYLGDAVLAEDIFQNTFLKVYEKIHQYEPGRPVRPWLYTIATHQAVDALRRVNRRSAVSLDRKGSPGAEGDQSSLADLLVSKDQSPQDALSQEEQKQALRMAVEELPELYREVLLLAYYQEMKYKDIAEVLRVPVGTVKSRLHAAVGKLLLKLRGSADGALAALDPQD